MEPYLGKGQTDLLAWLTGDWLKAGKPVCFLEGFSGIGKTTVARELEVRLKHSYKVVRVDMPEAQADPVGDLLLEIATRLHELDYNEIADAINGGRDKAAAALVNLLRSSSVVIVIDEFQRAVSQGEARPVSDVESLIARIAQRTSSKGRVLLLTNRRIAHEKWSEPYEIRTLPGLTVEEAERLLEARLTDEGRAADVPPERRRDVVNWLGRNPRAVRVLVSALVEDSLDYLIDLNPESWEARDREVSAELLRSLERNLLERNLVKLETDVAAFLYRLSVYRRAFKREAMQQMVSEAKFEALKSELINRFFVELHLGWFSLHEIVREISLQKLKQNPEAFRQAHGKAGEYFARPFKAKQMVGGELGAQFVEARYHLVQAQREDELRNIANRFGNYLKETYHGATPIPQRETETDERIAILSALLVTPGPKGLEYYLARLLKHRGNPLDLRRALEHACVVTDRRDASDQEWWLRVELEERLHGVVEAIKVARYGLSKIRREQSGPLYQTCAELMAKIDRTDEAIAVLKDGIAKVPTEQSAPLYQRCAELMAKAGRDEEAIEVLRDGIARVPSGQGSLYQFCAELMAKAGRDEEAIVVLKDGFAKVPTAQSAALYENCATLIAGLGRIGEAIDLLKDGIGKIPPKHSVYSLYLLCARLLGGTDRLPEAFNLLREGMRSIPIGESYRHTLSTLALRLCASSEDTKTLDSILMSTGKDALDKPQVYLGNSIRLQIQQEWEQAALCLRSGRSEFPTNFSLAAQEAFSWLCASQPEAADSALGRFPLQIQIGESNPNNWLLAFIALRNGKMAEARQYLTDYLGCELSGEEVNEGYLLRLWDTPVSLVTGAGPATFYPTLPPSLTGLANPVTRQTNRPPLLPELLPESGHHTITAATPTLEGGQKVLVVATEWESKYGGLSTFNRELCKAMSLAGHKVYCLIPKPTLDEIASAKTVGVELVPATPTEEASDRELLFRRPALPQDFNPQIIIGHDRITGAPAQAQVADFFPHSRFVLFIHTAPGEIEWHKARAEGENTSAETAEQRERAQRELGRQASLVVAVGPRLKREIEANLVSLNVPIVQLNPGLPDTKRPAQPLEAIYCLLLGRADDEKLKGLDIAARALGQLLQEQSSTFSVTPELIVRGATPKTGDILREELMTIGRPFLKVRVKEYTPQLNRITEDIHRASVVLMPSRSEGFGLVGLEAIAAGVPVLISSNSGLGELLREKLPSKISARYVVAVTGDLETDSRVWAHAIELVLRDRDAAFAQAAELRASLSSSLSWERSVTALFETLVSTKSAGQI